SLFVNSFRGGLGLVAGLLASSAYAQFSTGEAATENVTAGGIYWQVHVEYDTVELVVAGPEGEVFRRVFDGHPSYALVDDHGGSLPDGSYNYELIFAPYVDPSTRDAMAAAREVVDRSDSQTATDVAEELGLPTEPVIVSGNFRTFGGSIVRGGTEISSLSTLTAPPSSGGNLTPQTLVVPENLIVQGNTCTGTDCANGEPFGFDTLRLKENNLRILFMDTSVGTFPTTDWQLTANDTTNGGASRFSIDDIDNGRTPFTIEGAAPTNSLYVDSTGNVGFGTSTPVLEVHARDGDTAALRLEQDTSSGFAAQTWDVAGNETNFFVRDVTHGSKLPLRILANATDRSIVLAASGVGIGTDNPRDRLHVANGILRVEAEDGTIPGLRFVNATQSWLFESLETGIFSVRDETTGTTPLRVFPGGAENTLVLVNGRVGIGTTTPSAKLDVSGPIVQRGGVLQADYVFDPGYRLESIEEHSAFMWRERHLPAVPKMQVDASGMEVVEIGAQRRGILEELEKAHIYIEQLNLAILAKEERIEGLESENAAILDRLHRIEALLSAREDGSENRK
ncbi:MAG TPA: hypothetical protein VEK15_01645, partial [Vicinamibacteria bacterium]|nr:hypothetical protein [Vicinamibacteria bacterium]